MDITALSQPHLYQMLSLYRPGQTTIEIKPELLPVVHMGALMEHRIMSPEATVAYLDMGAQIWLRKLDSTGQGHEALDYKHLKDFIWRFSRS